PEALPRSGAWLPRRVRGEGGLPVLPAGRAARVAFGRTRITGPHIVGCSPRPLRVPIHEHGIEAIAVTEMDDAADREASGIRRSVVAVPVVAVIVLGRVEDRRN